MCATISDCEHVTARVEVIPRLTTRAVAPHQELNKLISYSGTPTVVWRRTGEICLVGPEFCMLTEWSKEELLGTKKYIWEVSSLGTC